MSVPGRLGRYEIQTLIGRGAMGAVYKARDPAIDRWVAVKTVGGTLLAWADQQEEFVERFRREARAAGRLTHPHIVSVYDLGVDETTETPFIVMEYVAGVSLATLLKENALLPVEQALEMVDQIASALEEAHHHGIVHRDIKPGNIFMDQRGRVKVGDFGIARLPGSELTQPGVGLGTPGYLAPELASGAAADPRTDLFSLGVVAYQLLTGMKPFERAKGRSATDKITPPHLLRPDVPEAASLAVMRCLAKDPQDRPEGAKAFLKEMRRGESGAAPTVTILSPAPTPRRSRRLVLLGAAALLVAALVGLALLLSRSEPRVSSVPTPQPPTQATPRPLTSPPATRPAMIAPAPAPTWAPRPGEADPAKSTQARPARPHDRDDDDDEKRPAHDRGKDKSGHGKAKGKSKGKEH